MRWTEAEDARLLEAVRETRNATQVGHDLAEELGRSSKTIAERARHMARENDIKLAKRAAYTDKEQEQIYYRYRDADPAGRAALAQELGISLTWLRSMVSNVRSRLRAEGREQ